MIAGLAAMAPITAHARAASSSLKALSGDRFMSNDQEFLLADIIAPPLYSLNEGKPPHFESSRAALDEILSEMVETSEALPPTRWGVRRVIAHNADGQSLQAVLVASGAARVRPQSADQTHIQNLLAVESVARKEQRGLWGLPDYRVHNANSAEGAIGNYNLIEGVVTSAEKHGGRFYLNFGDDYRTDFTAGAAAALNSKWLKAGTDLSAMAGARLRVRGYVEAINGPSIDLKHHLQIEQLG